MRITTLTAAIPSGRVDEAGQDKASAIISRTNAVQAWEADCNVPSRRAVSSTLFTWYLILSSGFSQARIACEARHGSVADPKRAHARRLSSRHACSVEKKNR